MRLLAALGALVWVVTSVSVGPVAAGEQAAALTPPVAITAVPAAPALCPGCSEFVLDLPAEPSTPTFGTEANSTADVLVTFPSGFSSLACADRYDVIARDAADGGGVPVPGWTCTVPSLNTVRFTGPGAVTIADSAQRFAFRARSPGPVEGLSAGFVDIVQTFRDGEQQRRRGMKQIQARRTPATDLALDVVVDLPPDWTAECVQTDGDPRVGRGRAGIQQDGWICTPVPGTGTHPRFRVKWTGGAEDERARFYYFDAVTDVDQPTLRPLTTITTPAPTATSTPAGADVRLRDLMFVDGQIRTELIAFVQPGTITPPPTPTPTATVSATPTPSISPTYQPLCPTPTPPAFGTTLAQQPGYPFGYGPPPGYPEGPFVYPQKPMGPAGPVPFPGYPFAVGPGIDGLAHDPCAPPTVVIDPCAGEVFTKNGVQRFAAPDRPLPPGCAYPAEPQSIAYHGDVACLPTRPGSRATHHPPPPEPARAQAERPAAKPSATGAPTKRPKVEPGRDGRDGGYEHEPFKATRSYQRPPLRQAAEPTPPVVLVPPDDPRSVAPDPGSAEGRILLASPNPSPAPTIRALLPEPQAALPYCDDLPDTGSGAMPLLRLALLVLAGGSALVAGAVYWRRNAPRGLRYTRP